MDVLIVGAHPDDETLGAGGTIAKHTEKGNRVTVISLGNGVGARDSYEDIGLRKQNFYDACARLGAVKCDVLMDWLPDNAFDSEPLLKIIKPIEQYIRDLKPDVVYTHHRHDLNIDHRITFEAVLTACRPQSGILQLFSFEVPSATETAFSQGNFHPQFYVELEERHFDAKMEAIQRYKDELRPYPHPRSKEGIETYARWRGMQCCRIYAEAFEVVRVMG